MLVHNWRAVLRRAWSVRLMALALIFIILEPVINFVAGTWIPRNVYIQLAMSGHRASLPRRRSSPALSFNGKSQEN